MQAKQIFEILMRENADMLRAYLRASVQDTNVADDLFQETMLVAWRRLADFDQQRSLGPWLRGIASKLILAHYRKRSAREQPMDQPALDWLESRFTQLQKQPGDSFTEKLTALRECVDSLPDNYREPIRMKYQQDLSLAEIGQNLSLAVEALKKRLTRGKQKLTVCLNRKLTAGESLS